MTNNQTILANLKMTEAIRAALAYLPALAEHLEASEMPGHAGNVTLHIKRLRRALEIPARHVAI